MALASYDRAVDTSVHVVASEIHGASIQNMSLQVHPEGFSRRSPDIILPLQEFDSACEWLEQHTLIGYFVGRTLPEAMLREWVNKSWTLDGVYLHALQNLTKGFFYSAPLTYPRLMQFLAMALGQIIPPSLCSNNGREALQSLMTKSLGCLFGLSSLIYPFLVGRLFSPLPTLLAKFLLRNTRSFLMLSLNDTFALSLISQRISRIL